MTFEAPWSYEVPQETRRSFKEASCRRKAGGGGHRAAGVGVAGGRRGGRVQGKRRARAEYPAAREGSSRKEAGRPRANGSRQVPGPGEGERAVRQKGTVSSSQGILVIQAGFVNTVEDMFRHIQL